MLVSVILPLYNEEVNPLLEETFKSIFNQSIIPDIELIIIDDGSTDRTIEKTEAILLSLPHKKTSVLFLKNNTNLGIAESLNKGIRHAQGIYIARIDGGDIMHPQRIEKQIDYFKKNKNVFLLGTLTYGLYHTKKIIFPLCGEKNIPHTPDELRKRYLYNCYISHPSWLVRKELFDRIGFYDKNHRCEDYELCLRSMSQGYDIALLPEYLTIYLKDLPGSVTNKYKKKVWADTVYLKFKYFKFFPSLWNFRGILRSLRTFFETF